MSHSVGQPLQFETCCTFYRSLSQKRFPKNKAVGKGKPEKAGQCWKSIDIQSLVSTCRTHEVNPYTWLVDVMHRIDPSRPRCGAADATTAEGELCRQPVDLRHRKASYNPRSNPQPERHISTPAPSNVPKRPDTLRRRQDDQRSARSPDPLHHPRDRQRLLALPEPKLTLEVCPVQRETITARENDDGS